jgi:hypothetical protein
VTRKLHHNHEVHQNRWIMIHQDLLDGGRIETLVF